MEQKKIWFVTGSQHLYGDETLRQVKSDSVALVEGLNATGKYDHEIVFKALLTTPDEIEQLMKEANYDDMCIGIVGWMHTFSPAKMWIKGFNILAKPFAQLHTQYQREIPWQEIDMDFMNLNQTAHGGREFGFIQARMRVPRKIIVGYWQDSNVQDQLKDFMDVARGIDESKHLKVVRFGDNMRQVAVTEGDKVEAEITFGWSVNTYAVGDLVKVVNEVTETEVDTLIEEYQQLYTIEETSEASMNSIREQARLEIGIERFLLDGGFKAFTTTFEDLHGLKQLPGLAVQRLMAKGYGFGAEGDWKTAAMLRIMKVMAGNKTKGTSFMEDYTYHMDPNNEVVLGAHMLEVCPTIASDKPSIIVRPLGIGGKNDPARMIFTSETGSALNASMIDMGGRMRLIINTVEAIGIEENMPQLPVAKALWKPMPDFETGVKSWILAGGAHHTIYSFDVNVEQLEDFAEFFGIETVLIDKHTTFQALKKELTIADVVWNRK